MKQTYITIEGTKLFYAEKNAAAAQTIFFLHGNSSSHLTWQQQFKSEQLSDYRLIAFDLPAHGLSDAASLATEGYSLPGIASLMAKAVIQLAGKKPYILTGFSLGTNIISEMLSYYVMPAGIVLISPCVISTINDLQRVFLPNLNAGILFKDEIDMKVLNSLAEDSFFSPDVDRLERCVQDFVATKAPFRSLLIKSSVEAKVSDEIAALRKSGIPLLVIFGKDERNVNPDHMDGMSFCLWRDNIFKLQKARHFVHIDQPDVVNQLLADYTKDRFTSVHS